MVESYFSFGQEHKHVIHGFQFNKDMLVKITGDNYHQTRAIMFALFGDKWSFEYRHNQITEKMLPYFPRGIFEIYKPTINKIEI